MYASLLKRKGVDERVAGVVLRVRELKTQEEHLTRETRGAFAEALHELVLLARPDFIVQMLHTVDAKGLVRDTSIALLALVVSLDANDDVNSNSNNSSSSRSSSGSSSSSKTMRLFSKHVEQIAEAVFLASSITPAATSSSSSSTADTTTDAAADGGAAAAGGAAASGNAEVPPPPPPPSSTSSTSSNNATATNNSSSIECMSQLLLVLQCMAASSLSSSASSSSSSSNKQLVQRVVASLLQGAISHSTTQPLLVLNAVLEICNYCCNYSSSSGGGSSSNSSSSSMHRPVFGCLEEVLLLDCGVDDDSGTGSSSGGGSGSSSNVKKQEKSSPSSPLSSSSSAAAASAASSAAALRSLLVQCFHGGAREHIRDGSLAACLAFLRFSSCCSSSSSSGSSNQKQKSLVSWTIEPIEPREGRGRFANVVCAILRGEIHLLLEEALAVFRDEAVIDALVQARAERVKKMAWICFCMLDELLTLLAGDEDGDVDEGGGVQDEEQPSSSSSWSSLPFDSLLKIRVSMHSIMQELFDFLAEVAAAKRLGVATIAPAPPVVASSAGGGGGNGSSTIGWGGEMSPELHALASRAARSLCPWIMEDQGLFSPFVSHIGALVECSIVPSSISVGGGAQGDEEMVWRVLAGHDTMTSKFTPPTPLPPPTSPALASPLPVNAASAVGAVTVFAAYRATSSDDWHLGQGDVLQYVLPCLLAVASEQEEGGEGGEDEDDEDDEEGGGKGNQFKGFGFDKEREGDEYGDEDDGEEEEKHHRGGGSSSSTSKKLSERDRLLGAETLSMRLLYVVMLISKRAALLLSALSSKDPKEQEKALKLCTTACMAAECLNVMIQDKRKEVKILLASEGEQALSASLGIGAQNWKKAVASLVPAVELLNQKEREQQSRREKEGGEEHVSALADAFASLVESILSFGK